MRDFYIINENGQYNVYHEGKLIEPCETREAAEAYISAIEADTTNHENLES